MKIPLKEIKQYFTGENYVNKNDTRLGRAILKTVNYSATLADIGALGYGLITGDAETATAIAAGAEVCRNATNWITEMPEQGTLEGKVSAKDAPDEPNDAEEQDTAYQLS